MDYNFYREKNANSLIEKFKVEVPSNEVLIKEIKLKFLQKADMIEVIFNAKKRQKYLEEKHKTIPPETSEFEIQQKIGLRVLADFLDLETSLAKCYNLSLKQDSLMIESSLKYLKLDSKRLSKNVCKLCKKLQKGNKMAEILLKINENLKTIAVYLKFTFEDIKTFADEIEKKEGSFYKGKLVYNK